MLLGGCHHRQVPPTLPAVLKAPEAQPPTPEAPAMDTAPPATISTAPPAVKVTEVKPKRRPKKASSKASAVPAPAETAPASPPQALGALSAGGESNPKSQQDANDLIASTERRLTALSKTTATQQEAQTREVQRFLQQARQALSTGDLEGAKTLATKAKLLMDDLEKWLPQS